ncbi:hypothetical protein WA171_004686 [Blastocystis sp. BT1]
MDSDQSVCDSSMLLQASLTMEDDIPTLWSADLREGLSMMDIQFSDIPDSQIQLVYSLYNTLSQAANVYLCDDSILPLVLPTEELKNELNKRKVYFKEDDSREVLIHLLEMDILLRSSEVKGGYVDYRIRRITPFDVFNNVYGNYTGPMLSKLLKEKGITPPRRVKDRVQLVVNRIDMAMRESFREAFYKVTLEYYKLCGGEKPGNLNDMFHFLLSTTDNSLQY